MLHSRKRLQVICAFFEECENGTLDAPPIIRLTVYPIMCIYTCVYIASRFFQSRIFVEHLYQTEGVRVLASS